VPPAHVCSCVASQTLPCPLLELDALRASWKSGIEAVSCCRKEGSALEG